MDNIRQAVTLTDKWKRSVDRHEGMSDMPPGVHGRRFLNQMAPPDGNTVRLAAVHDVPIERFSHYLKGDECLCGPSSHMMFHGDYDVMLVNHVALEAEDDRLELV